MPPAFVEGARERSACTGTQSLPSIQATFCGLLPTSIVRTTSLRVGSTCEIVPSRPFATHTEPPPTATAVGRAPTRIVVTTDAEVGSIRISVLPVVTAQTAPAPTARPVGTSERRIGVCARVRSMRTTALSSACATQTAPAPTATATGPPLPVATESSARPAPVSRCATPSPAGTQRPSPDGGASKPRACDGCSPSSAVRDTTLSNSGLIRSTDVPEPTQTPSPFEARTRGGAPAGIVRTTCFELGVDPRDRPVGELPTQTEPKPAVMLAGSTPTGTSATTLAARRVDHDRRSSDDQRRVSAASRRNEGREREHADGSNRCGCDRLAHRRLTCAHRLRSAGADLASRLARFGNLQPFVVSQDLLLEPAQLGAWFQPELVAQRSPRLDVRLERVGLTARAVKGKHQLAA